jgi:hypothetical protein
MSRSKNLGCYTTRTDEDMRATLCMSPIFHLQYAECIHGMIKIFKNALRFQFVVKQIHSCSNGVSDRYNTRLIIL